jgi:citrate lyase subunit beta/citryl-CoA lyase
MNLDVASVALLLFVPADRPERFRKAASAGPDAIIIDLEDAVPSASKDPAPQALRENVEFAKIGLPIIVRINAVGTTWHKDDVRAVRELKPFAILLPKAGSASDIARVADETSSPVIALVETARDLAQIANMMAMEGAGDRPGASPGLADGHSPVRGKRRDDLLVRTRAFRFPWFRPGRGSGSRYAEGQCLPSL